jgi:hypothetical protein
MLLPSLPDHARLWVFTASRALAPMAQDSVMARVRAFLPEWVSHGRPVAAEAAFLHDRALVVGALLAQDEGDISGCGIDAMTHAVEASAEGFSWLDGLHVTVRRGDEGFEAMPRATLRRLAREGAVAADTEVLDAALPTVGALRKGGLARPLGATALGRALGVPTPA